MGKSKPKQEVTQYRMSIHYGVCAGPVDAIFEVLVQEKSAWSGSAAVEIELDIKKEKLFGGIKKEGGLSGSMYFLPGDSEQFMPARLASKFTVPDGLGGTMTGTPDTMPAYRGLTSVFFTERAGASRPGFYWTANNPYLQGAWITVGRGSVGLDDSIARIYWASATTPVGDQLSFPPDVHVMLGGDGNFFDTAGNYAAHFGHHITDASTPYNTQGPFYIWTLDTGEVRSIPSEGFHAGYGIAINRIGQLVAMQGGSAFGGGSIYLKFYNLGTLALEQSIDVSAYQTSYGLNGGLHSDDIIIGSDHYAFVKYGSTHGDLMLLKRDSGSWVFQWNEPGTFFDSSISMGTQYAYFIRGATETAASASEVFRVQWNPTFQIDIVEPDGIAGREIYICGYFHATDEVIIVCTNGDLLVYSADLSVLKRSRLGLGARFGQPTSAFEAGESLLSKRMTVSDTMIAIPQWVATGISPDVLYIHQISVDTLATVTLTTVADTTLINRTEFFRGAAVNAEIPGLLMFDDTHPTFWPFVGTGKFDSNPAHMIYECLLNPDWGMGTSSFAIDFEAFSAAAQTLYGERFGLSMIWLRQTTIEAFVQEILDHIEATLFINPRTGLITLKLIRNDYDIDALPIYTPDNSRILNFKRKLWGETVNEINVTWTNPANEEEETVTVQDDANIASQDGQIVSDGRNYYGIRNADLATKVGYRDLRVAASPIATCDIEIDREAWDLLPGDVCKIVSPEDHITVMVMRVGPLDYGRIGSPEIRASLTEDVFALATAEYDTPASSSWEDPSQLPTDAAFEEIITLPYYFAVNTLDGTPETAYPTVYAGLLVAQTGADTFGFELWGTVTDSGGTSYETELGERSILSRATLAVALTEEADSIIAAWPAGTQGVGPEPSGFAIIGNGDETEDEIVFITSDDGVAGAINRGVLDTVPRAWPIGTPIWYISADDRFHDNIARSAAEVVTYKALTMTSLGTLDPDDATPITATLSERPHLPLRPANCAVNGVSFGSSNCDGVDPIPITVSERNRLTEDAVVLAWDDATVTPEVGQTWQMVLMEEDRTPITTIVGLTGTSYSLDPAEFAGANRGIIRFEAERDGLISLQGFEITVILNAGYGIGYGYNYGGA